MVNRTIEKILLAINLIIGAAVIALVVMAKVNPQYFNYLDKYVTGNMVYVLYGLAGVYVLTGLLLLLNRVPFKTSSVYVYSYAQKHKRVTEGKLTVAAKAAAERVEGIKDVDAKILLGEYGSQLHIDIKLDKRYDFSLVTEQYFPVLEEVIKSTFGIRFPCYKFAHGKIAYEYSLPVNIPVPHDIGGACDSADKEDSGLSDGVKKDELAISPDLLRSEYDEDDEQSTYFGPEDIINAVNEDDDIHGIIKSAGEEPGSAFDTLPTESQVAEGGLNAVADIESDAESEQDYVNRQIINSLNEVYDEDYIPAMDNEEIGFIDEAEAYPIPEPKAMPATKPKTVAATPVRRTSPATRTTAAGRATTARGPAAAPARAASSARTRSASTASAGAKPNSQAAANKPRAAATATRASAPVAKAKTAQGKNTNNDVYDRINAIIDKYTKPQGKDTK